MLVHVNSYMLGVSAFLLASRAPGPRLDGATGLGSPRRLVSVL